MDPVSDHSAGGLWELAGWQHGVVSVRQLREAGVDEDGVKHRVARGRLHPIRRGVYAVGRPELTRHGHWMAAVLACGDGAVLSHGSAAALWGFGKERQGIIDVSAVAFSRHRHPGLMAHRRSLPPRDLTVRHGIPVASVVRTLIDRAAGLDRRGIEREVSEADKLGLTTPPDLRGALHRYRGQRGVARLREALDRRTFRLTDSELERYFLPVVREVGLPMPRTRQHVNGFRVDFFWPDLRFVIETDGLTYHRTPAQQAEDLVRDQTHVAAGYTPLRFTHEQVRYESEYVRRTLSAVVVRLSAGPPLLVTGAT
jgi:very-short-patch-repair endonuclease